MENAFGYFNFLLIHFKITKKLQVQVGGNSKFWTYSYRFKARFKIQWLGKTIGRGRGRKNWLNSQSRSKLLGQFSVFLPSQYWCPNYFCLRLQMVRVKVTNKNRCLTPGKGLLGVGYLVCLTETRLCGMAQKILFANAPPPSTPSSLTGNVNNLWRW